MDKKDYGKIVKSRKKYNKAILEKIDKIIDACPDLRFIQILWALEIIDGHDRFNEEPDTTYKVVEMKFKKLMKIDE